MFLDYFNTNYKPQIFFSTSNVIYFSPSGDVANKTNSLIVLFSGCSGKCPPHKLLSLLQKQIRQHYFKNIKLPWIAKLCYKDESNCIVGNTF